MASPPLDPSVAAYYDTRIKLTDPSNASQLAALNQGKQDATSTYATVNTDFTKDIFKIMSLGPQGVDADPQLAKERDYLMQQGFLSDVPANTGEGNTPERYTLGQNAPHTFASYEQTGDTPPEAARMVNVAAAKGNDQSLVNPNAIAHTQLWGDMTYQGNIKQPSSGWDSFWTYAPMVMMTAANALSGGTLTPMQSAMMSAMKLLPTAVSLLTKQGKDPYDESLNPELKEAITAGQGS